MQSQEENPDQQLPTLAGHMHPFLRTRVLCVVEAGCLRCRLLAYGASGGGSRAKRPNATATYEDVARFKKVRGKTERAAALCPCAEASYLPRGPQPRPVGSGQSRLSAAVLPKEGPGGCIAWPAVASLMIQARVNCRERVCPSGASCGGK